METTFLKNLALETIQKHGSDFEEVCFVLPSKRSGLFFKKELAEHLQTTFWSPTVVTIDSFIEEISGLQIIDPLEQLFELFEVHKELNIQPQLAFDRFIEVGKIILADFNDIDMALASANDLFKNVIEFRAIEQWSVDGQEPGELQAKYLEAFSNLPKYYEAYQKRLLKTNKAYQGLVYRKLSEEISNRNVAGLIEKLDQWKSIYVAGLNALTPAEQNLFNWLKEEKSLEVYFEAENQMVTDLDQESGQFIRKFYKKEGPDFKWAFNHLKSGSKEIHTYSVNGNLSMARMVGDLFDGEASLTSSNETAVILADEGLLIPVLESLPEKIGEVNVTLGFPLGLTSFMSFTEQLFGMQSLATMRNGIRNLYYKDVVKVLSHPIFVSISDSRLVGDLMHRMNNANLVWVPEEVLIPQSSRTSSSNLIKLLFQDWVKSPKLSIQFLDECLLVYQKELLKDSSVDDVLVEQLYFFKQSVIRLKQYLNRFNHSLSLDGIRRLFKQVVAKIEVPFSGEPLAGVQVLGLLETRLLSFKNVILVSANEGVIPSKGGFQSFLPFGLRNGFDIQTHQHRESIFAYHFYRILSQADNIHLIYDSSTTGVGHMEKSRFIRQIEQEWPEINPEIKFQNHIGVFESSELIESDHIEKTPDVIKNIKSYLQNTGLSPSALNTYIESPIDFYYGNVIGIRQPKVVEEDMEHNTFGSIVHDCLEKFYIPFEGRVLQYEEIQKAYAEIDALIKEVFSNEISFFKRGKHYLSYYSVKSYVKRFIQLDMDFIKECPDVITMIKNEMNLKRSLRIDGEEYRFKGKSDRVESRNGNVYIIDYKTGSVEAKDLSVKDFEAIEDGAYKSKLVQLLMYAWLSSPYFNDGSIVSGIYTLRNTKLELLPATISGNKELGQEEFELFERFLGNKIREMLNPEIPLTRNSQYKFGVF